MEENQTLERKRRGRRKKIQHPDDNNTNSADMAMKMKLKLGSIQAGEDNPRNLCKKTPVCRICAKSFLSWKSLYGHMRSHSRKLSRHSQPDEEDEEEEIDLLREIPPWPVTGKRGRRGGPFPKEVMEAARNLMLLSGGPRLWASRGSGHYFWNKRGRRDCNCTDDPRKCKCCSVVVGPKKRGRKKKDLTKDSDSGRVLTRPVFPDGFRCVTCKKEFSTHQALGGHRSKHYKDRIGGGRCCLCGPGPGLETGSATELVGSCLVPTKVYQWGAADGKDGWAGRFGMAVDVNQAA